MNHRRSTDHDTAREVSLWAATAMFAGVALWGAFRLVAAIIGFDGWALVWNTAVTIGAVTIGADLWDTARELRDWRQIRTRMNRGVR